MTAPRLSICVPTHHGRGGKLDQLLARVAAEPGQELVEVCVSDNASHDGTEQIIERHRASFGDRLRYRRNETNVGWGENLLRAVELADGDYCWLMGSDDAPAPNSINRLLALIEEHDGTSGIHLGHLRVTPDLRRVGTAVAAESYPPERVTTRMRGAREVGVAGYLTLFVSNNVVNRELWQKIAEAERSRMLEFPLVPHMYMMGRMAAAHPDWVWCPELLVISREGDIFLREPGEIGSDTRIVRELIAELDRLWRLLHGRRSYVRRALLFKALRQMVTANDLLALRMSVKRVREQLALLGLTRHFWWSREYWLRSVPAMLVPVAPLRYASGGPRRYASRRVGAHDRSVQVHGELPRSMHTGYATWASVRVVNRSSAALSSAGPFSAWLACRWEDPESGEVVHSGSPTKLWPPLPPEASRMVELSLTPPPLPGRYLLSIAPVEQYDGWYDLDQRASGVRSLVDVEPIGGLQPSEIVAASAAATVTAGEAGDGIHALPGLDEMVREMNAADERWGPLASRRQRGERTLRALETGGLEAALATLTDASIGPSAITPPAHRWAAAARLWLRSPLAPVPSLRFQQALAPGMWDQARRQLGARLDALEEPHLSSDRSVRFRGRNISCDLAAAALELATIAEVVPHERLTTACTIELGGGYGRRAWVMLSMHRDARYVIVDAAPSLAVAQLYLAETLPQRRVFRFRRFDDPDRVIEELLASEIAFLTPNQLSLLPAIGADLWLSICSLEGLTHQQVQAHFAEADRHVTGWAYSKQARISASPADGVALEQTDYPYPARWHRALERPATVQRSVFEAIFEIPAPPA